MLFKFWSLTFFLGAGFFALLDLAPVIVLAHHCGPTQPLPQYPRHSCRTHTQTWQPGEKIDQHPGGAKGRGPGDNPPQAPSNSCTYYVDARRIDEMLRARPGVCQRYGPDRIICQGDVSQPTSGGSPPQAETWDAKLNREIVSEVERQATGAGFNRTRTQLRFTILANGGWQRAAIAAGTVRSDDYVRLADQVVGDFMNSGRTRPPDNRTHNLTLVLGAPLAASQPANSAQPGGQTCTYVAGQLLQGNAEEKVTAENRPTYATGTDTGVFPYASNPVQPPQTTPAITLVYGKAWRRPAGQTINFPISILVPTSLSLDVYKEGPITPGPEGQYYTQFGGRLLRQWRAAQPGRREQFGSFRIETLYTASGAKETGVNITVPLGSVQP